MVQILREGKSVRVVLVNGDAREAAPIVSELRRVLNEDGVGEIVVDIPGNDLPSRAVVSDVMHKLESEASARGVSMRFSL